MTMTAQQLREKISAWLSDKTNHEGDLVDFLVDDCGVEYNPEWEDEEEEEEICDGGCNKPLLICDSGMKLCSVGCKDKWVKMNSVE